MTAPTSVLNRRITAVAVFLGVLASATSAAAVEVDLPTGPSTTPPPGDPPAGAGMGQPAEPQPTTTTTRVVPLRTLRMGSRGARVRDLQRALRKRRIRVKVDGVYGRGTRRGVRIVQKRLKLRATGVATAGFQRRMGLRPRRTTITVARPVGDGRFSAFPVARDYSYSSDFGAPRHQGSHEGTDIIAPRGTPIRAVNDGVIDRLTRVERGLGGLYIWLKGTDDTTDYYYAHMDSVAPGLKEGTRVTAGQIIGTVGNTGDARFGVHHLHFEWRPFSRPANPYPNLVSADPTKRPRTGGRRS